MSYWSDPNCQACKEAGLVYICPRHYDYGQGFEAGFDAAMRSTLRPTLTGNGWVVSKPGAIGFVLTMTGQWAERSRLMDWTQYCFGFESEARDTISKAPRWWPAQPWEKKKR